MTLGWCNILNSTKAISSPPVGQLSESADWRSIVLFWTRRQQTSIISEHEQSRSWQFNASSINGLYQLIQFLIHPLRFGRRYPLPKSSFMHSQNSPLYHHYKSNKRGSSNQCCFYRQCSTVFCSTWCFQSRSGSQDYENWHGFKVLYLKFYVIHYAS